jgi:hypothetical protein
MRKFRNVGGLCLALALLAGSCFAEEASPAKFYKVEFVVKEVEGGKVLNARAYSAVTSTGAGRTCSIRTGSRVPIPTTNVGPSQYTYFDLGVNIDCFAVKEAPGQLTLRVEADISSTLQEPTTAAALPPVVRQNKWSSEVIVPLRKPTVIFSSDDVAGKRQMQLELTATPIP